MKIQADTLRTFTLALVLPAAMIACGTEPQERDDAPTKSNKAALWSCALGTSSVTCTAPLPSSLSTSAAYACKSGDDSDRCPDASCLDHVQGLDQALARVGGKDAFASLPWACLVTGKDQFQCTRPLSKMPTPQKTESAPAPSGGDTGDANGGDSCDCDSEPAPPASCAPTDWEPFFAKLASFEYHEHGVDIAFPRDIFDTSQGLTGVVTATGAASEVAGESCHDGEWAMRQQAWLDAVSQGCLDLNDAILTLCQQAADYAPTTGKCSATGTW